MKPAELKAMRSDELKAKGAELRKEIFSLRMRHSSGTLENPLRLRTLRRDVARIETIIRQKGNG
jgi:large subunit ribosomal protein L29